LVDKSVARYIKGNRNHYGFVSEKAAGNYMEMTFMTTSVDEGFARWYLMFGDYAKVIEPESLKTRLKDIIKKTEAKLAD
jgi:predicted DNA-binding transcriptional regulator YafY